MVPADSCVAAIQISSLWRQDGRSWRRFVLRAPDASGTPRAVAAECSPHEGSGSSPAAAIKASLLGSYDELIHHESDAEAMAGEAGPQSRPAPHRGDGKDDDGPARARSRARARAWNRLYMPRDDVLTRLKAGLLASVASPSAAAESVSGDGSGADSTASYVALSDDDGDGGVSRGVVDAPLAGQGEATVRGPGPSAPLPEVWQAMHEARMRYYLPIHELMGENTAYAAYVRVYFGSALAAFHFMTAGGQFMCAATCDITLKGPVLLHTIQRSWRLPSLSHIPTSPDCATFLGYISRNFTGSEFVVHDVRTAPRGRLHAPSPWPELRNPVVSDSLQYRAHPPNVRVHSSFRAPVAASSPRDSQSPQAGLLRGWGSGPLSPAPTPTTRAGPAPPPAGTRGGRRSTVGRLADAVRDSVSAMSRGLVPAEASAEEAAPAEAGEDAGVGRSPRGGADDEETVRRLRQQERVATAAAEVERVPAGCRCEVAAVRFRSRVPGRKSQGAPPFCVHLPRAYYASYTDGRAQPLLPSAQGGRSGQSVGFADHDDTLEFRTKQPVWDPGFRRYVLDYGRRARLHSKQNFVLQPSSEHVVTYSEYGREPVMRCGRMSLARYAVEFSGPLSIVQAHSIAVTTFLHKMLVGS